MTALMDSQNDDETDIIERKHTIMGNHLIL